MMMQNPKQYILIIKNTENTQIKLRRKMVDLGPILKKLDNLRRDEKFFIVKLHRIKYKLAKTRKQIKELEEKLR